MKMETRDFRTLGVLWLVYGALRIIAVAGLVVYSGTLALMWGALLNRVPEPLTLMTAFHVMLVVAIAWCTISAFFSFVAAVALMRGSSPARMDTLIAALLALPDLPLGVMLGVYTIFSMMRAPAAVEHSRSHSAVVMPLPQGSR
jgi:uncharacterized membrane protein